MGLIDYIFGRLRRDVSGGLFQTLTGYTPVFTSWGGELYESELVRASVDAIARHCSKLQAVVRGASQPKLQTALRLGPNSFQTWSQFFYRLATVLYMQNTAFIVPVVDELGRKVGIFPVLPSRCVVVECEGEIFLRYQFSSGQFAAAPLMDCGIMVRHQYKDDLFGDKNSAMASTMELINMQRQGISEGIKNTNSFRFSAQINNFMSPEDLKKERKRFTRENLRGDGNGGLLLFPNTYSNIKQLEYKAYVVDDKQMAQIQTNVFNYFGVNQDVLQNSCIGDKWSAFYEGCIEPFAIQFSEVVTRMLFTEREQGLGSMVMATSNRMQYMTNGDKLNVSSNMADRGLMLRDEIREIWQLPPLPDGLGQTIPARGEYYDLRQGNPNQQTEEGKNNGSTAES